MTRSVAVTGAAGFLGGHVVDALLAGGHRVWGIDRRPAPARLADRTGLVWLQAEVTAAPGPAGGPAAGAGEVRAALRAAGAVLHLAGCPGVRDASGDVEHRRRRDNVDATAVVLDHTPLGTPVLVTSSSSVYGGSKWARPSVETDPVDPRGGYAASKVLTERLCAARRTAGGAVLVVRPFTLAGERQRPDMAIAQWIDAARAGRPLRIFGAPERTRDVTDVHQAADVLVRLVAPGRQWPADAGTVNVGTGRSHTLTQLADAVRAATGRDVPVVVEPAAPVEVRHTLADTRRLQSLVDVVPSTDLAALVARQAAAQSRFEPAGAADPVSA